MCIYIHLFKLFSTIVLFCYASISEKLNFWFAKQFLYNVSCNGISLLFTLYWLDSITDVKFPEIFLSPKICQKKIF